MAGLFNFKNILGNGNASTDNNKPVLGINLGPKENINVELDKVTSQIQKTNKRYTDEIAKYKEVAAFNKKLSDSYVRNLQAMVDVSKLLDQYANVFVVLRQETEKLEKALGMDFKIEDFQYLENLTKDKMAELNNNFIKETESLKKLYDKFGKREEIANIEESQRLMKASISNASTTYQKLVELDKQSGGKKRRVKKSLKRKV